MQNEIQVVQGLDKLQPMYEVPASLHPALVYIASLSVGSRPTMVSALNRAADILSGGICDMMTLPWHLLRVGHVRALRSLLDERYSRTTANRILAAVRRTLHMAWELELLDTDSYLRASKVPDLKVIKAEAATGRYLTHGECMALLECCVEDESVSGLRDALILALGIYAGLRRAEIAGVTVSDIDVVQDQLRILGKGHRMRMMPIGGGLLDLILDWQHVLDQHLGPLANEQALLVSIKKGGKVQGKGLSLRAVTEIIEKRRVQAEVALFKSHDLRRTYASSLLDAGADISVVQQLMGHASATTTAGYDRRGQYARRRAMELLHMAYTRRYAPASKRGQIG